MFFIDERRMSMLLTVWSKGDLAEIKFWGNGTEWNKGDLICTRLHNSIQDLHKSGHRQILINMDKVEKIDNDSAGKTVNLTKGNPGVKLAFYNLQRYVRHSLMEHKIDKNLLFHTREAAVASFS